MGRILRFGQSMASIGKDNPLVSVIVPLRNRFNLVDEAVDAVYKQNYRPIELILVDDCSSQAYRPKIRASAGFSVAVIRHQENQGPGASRETGRRRATGAYLAYFDSDDLWHPTFLEKMVLQLKEKPETGMCYCKTRQFSGADLNSGSLRPRNEQAFDAILPTLLFGRPWSTGACLWTRRAADQIGPWSDGWTNEDIEYEFRAGIFGIQISHLPEVLCYERETDDPQQLSQAAHKKALLQKFSSIKLMATTVLENKHTLEECTRVLFLKKKMRPMVTDLFQAEEYEKVIELCKLMNKIVKPLSRAWLLTALLLASAKYRKFPGATKFFQLGCHFLT